MLRYGAGLERRFVIMADEILLTKEGYDKIVQELEELITVKRKEVAERIKEAISYGDISENSEYDSAKNEQAELEDRINNWKIWLERRRLSTTARYRKTASA
jgi:transcription elongation factor GreA